MSTTTQAMCFEYHKRIKSYVTSWMDVLFGLIQMIDDWLFALFIDSKTDPTIEEDEELKRKPWEWLEDSLEQLKDERNGRLRRRESWKTKIDRYQIPSVKMPRRLSPRANEQTERGLSPRANEQTERRGSPRSSEQTERRGFPRFREQASRRLSPRRSEKLTRRIAPLIDDIKTKKIAPLIDDIKTKKIAPLIDDIKTNRIDPLIDEIKTRRGSRQNEEQSTNQQS